MLKSLYTWLLPVLFLAYSVPIFLYVLATSKSVIDEEFHLRQGLHFCNKRFDVWDPKITTFPGLYMFSLILRPFNMCSVFGLRLISLAAAAGNVALFHKIRKLILGGSNSSLAALEAFTLAALPPLYFFSHVYYTDMLSLTTILLCYFFWLKEEHLQAAVYAAASVLVRQTNVVWVGMIFGITALDIIKRNYAKSKDTQAGKLSLFDANTCVNILLSFRVLLGSIWQIIRKCSYYLVIILPFVAFVFINGSIVVGDKRAHEATLHIPQLFYFATFALFFGISNTLQALRPVLRLLKRELIVALFLVGICLIIVKWNTLVHPYLLADNRHYIFYIWNRLYGRYTWFKYAICPLYILAFAVMHYGLRHMRDTFKIMFWVAVILTICFQRLLELRYFLIPFVIFRLNAAPTNKLNILQWLEFGVYMLLNVLTFYVFFTKEVKWENYVAPQRIIW